MIFEVFSSPNHFVMLKTSKLLLHPLAKSSVRKMLRSRDSILDFSIPVGAHSFPEEMVHHLLDLASPLRRGNLAPGFRILPIILWSKLQSHRSTQLL